MYATPMLVIDEKQKHDKIFGWRDMLFMGLVFVPFLVTYRNFPVVEQRIQFFAFVLVCTILPFFWLKSITLKMNAIDAIFSLLMSYDSFNAIFQTDGMLAKTAVVESLALLAFYWIVRLYVSYPDLQDKKFAYCISLFMVAQLIIGILQASPGSFANQTMYAHFLVMTFPILAWCILDSRLAPALKAIVLSVALVVVTWLAWESRTSIIVLFAALLAIGFIQRNGVSIPMYCWAGVGILSLAMIVWVASWNFDSINGRALVWSISTQVFSDHPLFGIGQGNFESVYPVYQVDFFKNPEAEAKFGVFAGDIDTPYNEFLRSLLEGGIVGLLCTVALLILVLWSYIGERSRACNFFMIAFVAIYVTGLMSYPFSAMPIRVFWGLLIALAAVKSSNKQFTISLRARSVIVLRYCLLCLGLGMTLLHIREWRDIREWQRYYTVNAANMSLGLQTPLTHDAHYMRDLARHYYKRHQYVQCMETLHSAKQLCIDSDLCILSTEVCMAMHDYDQALREAEMATHLIPHLVYPKYLKLKILMVQKKHQEALRLADIILAMPIKVSSITSNYLLNEVRAIRSRLITIND